MPTSTKTQFEIARSPQDAPTRTRFELVDRGVTWVLDRRRSSVQLHVDGKEGLVAGQFRDVRGSVQFHPEDPSRSTLGVEVDIVPVEGPTGGSPNRERLGADARRTDEPGLAMTFWTRSVEERGDGSFHVVGEITIPGATTEVELQVIQSGLGCDRDGTRRVHFWAWTRLEPARMGHRWQDALRTLSADSAHVIDVVMEVELMGAA